MSKEWFLKQKAAKVEQGYTETCAPCCGNCQSLSSTEKTPADPVYDRPADILYRCSLGNFPVKLHSWCKKWGQS